METKEIMIGKILMSIATVIFFALIIFAWPPVSHLYNKWSGYWDKNDFVKISKMTDKEETESVEAFFDRENKCEQRAREFFGSQKVGTFASSTSPDDSTYDCYGFEYTKIP